MISTDNTSIEIYLRFIVIEGQYDVTNSFNVEYVNLKHSLEAAWQVLSSKFEVAIQADAEAHLTAV
jgi:hypothetical protein